MREKFGTFRPVSSKTKRKQGKIPLVDVVLGLRDLLKEVTREKEKGEESSSFVKFIGFINLLFIK